MFHFQSFIEKNKLFHPEIIHKIHVTTKSTEISRQIQTTDIWF